MNRKLLNFILSGLLLVSLASRGSIDVSNEHNLSFELDEPGVEGVPQKWTFPSSPTVQCTISDDIDPNGSGEKSLMVDYSTAVEGDWTRMFESEPIAIDPEREYEFGFRLKTEGATAEGFGVSVGLTFYDESMVEIAPKTYDNRYQLKNSGAPDWVYFSQILRPRQIDEMRDFEANEIPSTARYIRIFFLSYSYDRKFWIDDFRFEPAHIGSSRFNVNNAKIVRSAVIKEPVVIDGRLEEPAWKDRADWNADFVRTVCPEGESRPAADQTRFKVAQDSENLYLGIECSSRNQGAITSPQHDHNSMDVFHDESVEIFLDASGNRSGCLQLGINSAGAFTELCYGIKRNLGLNVATARTRFGWTAEVKIPKSALWQLFTEAGLGVDNHLWNINVCRHQPSLPLEDRFSAWNYTGGQFDNKESLGVLVFDTNRNVLIERIASTKAQLDAKMKENGNLLTPSELAAIVVEQKGVLRAETFVNELQQAVQSSSDIPDHQFSKVLSDLDTIPRQVGEALQRIQRLGLAFPEERKEFGYMVYEVPLSSPVANDTYPNDGECKELKMRIARDEIKSKRFAIFARKALKGVVLSCSELKKAHGDSIPSENIDLRSIERWGSAHQADILVTDDRVKLEGYLENYAEHPRFVSEIPGNSSKHFLIQAAISKDQAPGIYEGSIRIHPENGKTTHLPVQIEVLPFQLERTNRYVGFFYTGVLHQPSGPAMTERTFYNGLATEASMRREFELLNSSGFNFVSLGGYAAGPLNIDYVSKVLGLASESGIGNIAVQGAEHFITTKEVQQDPLGQSENLGSLKQKLGEISEVAKKENLDVLIYGLDEPHDEGGILRNNVIFEAAKDSGLGTMTAIIRDDVRKQVSNLDVVSMNYSAMSGGDSQLLDQVSEGKEVPYRKTTYYANAHADQTPIVRLAFGWYLFKSHLEGNIPWAFYGLCQNSNPFADLGKAEVENGSYYVFPTKDRPIPTLKFEVGRTGVNDLRYLEMIERNLVSMKDSGSVQRYRTKLEKMLNTFSLINPKDINSENYLIASQTYDDFGDRIQEMLVEIMKEKAEGSKSGLGGKDGRSSQDAEVEDGPNGAGARVKEG